MLWIKALHIVFVASWFAGLFYLPRIFVNLAMETDLAARERLLLHGAQAVPFHGMIAGAGAGRGCWRYLAFWRGPGNGWLHAKLFAGGAGDRLPPRLRLPALRKFERGKNTRSHVWYRWFNEVPVLLMLAIVILVVVKPF
jgi:putative membrane protein